jgi:polyhydroxybutyrate depolymerase
LRAGLALTFVILAGLAGCDPDAGGNTPPDGGPDPEIRVDPSADVAPEISSEVASDARLTDTQAELVEDGVPDTIGDDLVVDGSGDLLDPQDIASDAPPVTPPVVWPAPTTEVGGARPAPAWVPTDYDPAEAWPLVLLLHGFGVTGFLQNGLFHLSPQVDALGILLVVPEGAKDSDGDQFWDAGWCCNWDGLPLDDVGYLVGLVDEMSALYNVDPSRVYAMGHSNGGFMAYRLACEAGDRFTAIMSLAGAQFSDPAACTPAVPVGLLQVHGTEDANVPYGGANNYVSAWDSAAYWAERDGCGDPAEGPPMDLDVDLDGPETVPTEWGGCPDSLRVALWTMEGVAHTPSIYDGILAKLAVEFLLSQSRP